MRLTQMIEALLFASDAPLAASDFCRLDERLDEDTVTAVIDELRAGYDREERSFQVYEVGGGFQLLTRPEYASLLERFDTVPQPAKLSAPALEVLAIVAYRQPIGRVEIDEIRGVQSSAVLRTLQERELIEPVGRSEGLGRPLLYGTTRKFLEHFGFHSLDDLPRPNDLPVVLRSESLTAAVGAVPVAEAAPATPATHGSTTKAAPAAPATHGTATEPTPLSSDAAAEAKELHIAVPDALKAAEAVPPDKEVLPGKEVLHAAQGGSEQEEPVSGGGGQSPSSTDDPVERYRETERGPADTSPEEEEEEEEKKKEEETQSKLVDGDALGD